MKQQIRRRSYRGSKFARRALPASEPTPGLSNARSRADDSWRPASAEDAERGERDMLTGLLWNCRYLSETLPSTVGAARERGLPLSLISVTMDCRDEISVRYGQVAADLALQHIAQLLQNHVRRAQAAGLARSGADTFTICRQAGCGRGRGGAHGCPPLRLVITGERLLLNQKAIGLNCGFDIRSFDMNADGLISI
ncbi:MAG: diguanylate cyclase [Eubacteriales bacterium]